MRFGPASTRKTRKTVPGYGKTRPSAVGGMARLRGRDLDAGRTRTVPREEADRLSADYSRRRITYDPVKYGGDTCVPCPTLSALMTMPLPM